MVQLNTSCLFLLPHPQHDVFIQPPVIPNMLWPVPNRIQIFFFTYNIHMIFRYFLCSSLFHLLLWTLQQNRGPLRKKKLKKRLSKIKVRETLSLSTHFNNQSQFPSIFHLERDFLAFTDESYYTRALISPEEFVKIWKTFTFLGAF